MLATFCKEEVINYKLEMMHTCIIIIVCSYNDTITRALNILKLSSCMHAFITKPHCQIIKFCYLSDNTSVISKISCTMLLHDTTQVMYKKCTHV